jgi:Ni2+-binding GTPase involved in maturation of urease and hydrogenase
LNHWQFPQEGAQHRFTERTVKDWQWRACGSGRTTLTEKLCKALRDKYSIAVITDDIYTKEDAMILMQRQAFPKKRIRGVETGGCATPQSERMLLSSFSQLRR